MAKAAAAGALLFAPAVHAEVLRRISYIFSILSLLPVLNQARWGSLSLTTKAAARRGKADDDQQADPDFQQDSEAQACDLEQQGGLGIPCILLLIASTLIGHHDLFKPASKKSIGKLGVLMQGVKNATSTQKTGAGVGVVGQGVAFVGTALATPEASSACHGIVMLIALLSLCALSGYKAAGRSRMLELCSRMVMVLPIGLFAAGYSGVLAKSWKALVSEKLTNTLPATLHAAGIVLANRHKGSNNGSFAACQFAALTASLWSEMLGSGSGVFAKLWAQPNITMLQDNEVLAITLPMLLAVVWILLFQLRDNIGMITLATMASAVTMPQSLSKIWPTLAQLIGTSPGDSAALLKLLSASYALSVLMLFFCGGTLAILGITIMGHLLMKIHGFEFGQKDWQ